MVISHCVHTGIEKGGGTPSQGAAGDPAPSSADLPPKGRFHTPVVNHDFLP
nr:MAG TPA: hypothetical protein [Caudoviricetes sp.]